MTTRDKVIDNMSWYFKHSKMVEDMSYRGGFKDFVGNWDCLKISKQNMLSNPPERGWTQKEIDMISSTSLEDLQGVEKHLWERELVLPVKHDFKEGDCIKFKAVRSNEVVYGRIVKLHEDKETEGQKFFNYIRDGVTPWSASLKVLERAEKISEEDFINSCQNSTHLSKEKIRSMVDLLMEDIGRDYKEVLAIAEEI